MRTSVIQEKELTYSFPMSDEDILARVRELNIMKANKINIENKKKLLASEIKSLQTEMEQMFNNISRREEEREVKCDVHFNYDIKTVEIMYKGQIMESRRMTDWEYSNRPADIYPEVSKTKVEAETKPEEGKAPGQDSSEQTQDTGDAQPDCNRSSSEETQKSPLDLAMERAEEIKAKEENMVAPSANTNAFSEAKTEASTIGMMPN